MQKNHSRDNFRVGGGFVKREANRNKAIHINK